MIIFLGLGRSAPCCVRCSDLPILFPRVGKKTARSCSDRPSLTLASVVPSISTLTWRTQCTRKWSTRWRYLANQNRITCWFTNYNTSRGKLRIRAGCKEGLDQLVKKDQSGSCTWMLIPVVITDWKAYVNHCRRYSINSSKYISEIVVWVLYRIAEIWFQSLKDVRPLSHVVRLGF